MIMSFTLFNIIYFEFLITMTNNDTLAEMG